MSVIVLVHLTGWYRRMRRVKRIEALYFLSFPSFAFLFCLKLTLLFAHSHFLLSFFSLGGRITADDVEVAAIAFFILDRSTKKKKNYSSFLFSCLFCSLFRHVSFQICQNENIILIGLLHKDFNFFFISFCFCEIRRRKKDERGTQLLKEKPT